MADENEEEHEHRNSAIIVSSFPHKIPMPGMPDMMAPARLPAGDSEDWVEFFERWINKPAKDGKASTKRIILLENVESMASTFDEWWPSLVEVVRRRRGDEDWQRKWQFSNKDSNRRPPAQKPTTIIFSSSPSVLRSQTCPPMPTINQTAAAANSNIHPMLQEIAERIGGTVEGKVESNDNMPLWWGSEESDSVGRRERESRRLSALLDPAKG